MYYIFCEAGDIHGYGHLMRCLSVAQGLLSFDRKVKIIIRGFDINTNSLSGLHYSLIDWLDCDYHFEGTKDDIAIIDSYDITEEVCSFVSNYYKKVMFFDDNRRVRYSSGYVLNSVVGAERLGYDNHSSVHYLLGSRYQSLRREFWNAAEYEFNQTTNKILITFGGSDPYNFTRTYIDIILGYYPESQIIVIIGPGFKNTTWIELYNNVSFIFNPSVERLVQIMQETDLAVSAAGQTISELARLGVPTIGIQVTDNQKFVLNNWKDAGFLLEISDLSTDDFNDKRKSSSINGKRIIDGKGVCRIVSCLLGEE